MYDGLPEKLLGNMLDYRSAKGGSYAMKTHLDRDEVISSGIVQPPP